MHCEQSVSDPKKSVVSWSPTYGREGDGMAWIKRGSIMVDIQNVERLDKVLKDGSIVARIVGWINEGSSRSLSSTPSGSMTFCGE
jgi:hypothetical protein